MTNFEREAISMALERQKALAQYKSIKRILNAFKFNLNVIITVLCIAIYLFHGMQTFLLSVVLGLVCSMLVSHTYYELLENEKSDYLKIYEGGR